MLALLSKSSGGPETLVLSELPEPIPGPGEVRIAVEACGVNYPDVLVIEDRYQFKPERPFAPGAEISGRIDAVGDGVSRFKIGDRVLGGAGWGGMAEKIVLPEDRCFAIPDTMPFDVAAAFLMTYGTTIHALRNRGNVRVGETMLVLGASGGVGLAAVELGKAYGAKVIAAVSAPHKAKVALDHGADATIIYPAEGLDAQGAKAFLAEIRAHAPDGVDIVYDAVGGDYAEPALRSMAWEGRYLVIGFPAGIPRLPLNLPLLKGCSIVGVFWGASIERSQEQHCANVEELMQLYQSGYLRPLVSERFPLARGGEAISRLASRAAVGKIVVTL
ncbi:NADPH:quinone oxidoreductase family protein [Sphingobium sp. HBC34]|uniref:NADPH:quinone oxidoreductase family protein n=1 Tax=Sphingobium cyanobacteriorum TaxID=3063954 RepID=A0ABT8ZQV4_9SPHN|nr:NADPH:quinone oxidoreductase family protein [Sphingobium sp. HBC34]MDO7836468.1 NADPH:quinone oxidoreductase family protein [Sphingobium sp. HBC34]